jgi:glycerophosphoryl diester phosphodiesterase
LLVLFLDAMAADRILVHGHRGARAALPESTLPGFEYAIKQGVDVLEMDLAVTKDNVLVVSHDPIPNPVICKGSTAKSVLRELTLKQVKQFDCGALKNPAFPQQKPVPHTKIPTLDEVLEMAKGSGVEFNIETKVSQKNPELAPPPEEFARLVLEALRRHGVEGRTMIQSFDFRTLHAMKKLDPAIRLSALYSGEPKSFVEIAREAGATIVSPHHTLVTRERVADAHRAGLQVAPWTANTPEEWRPLIDAGVDAIITDDPAALVSFLKKRDQ